MYHRQHYKTLCFKLPTLVNITSNHGLSAWSPRRTSASAPTLQVAAPLRSVISNCVADADDDKTLSFSGGKQGHDTLTRRVFLTFLITLAGCPIGFDLKPADAYSSPYRPGQNDDTNLPKRLFDKPQNEIVYTESGLQYFDLKMGSGTEAKDGSTVSVNYTTRLRGLNGIKVQSTFDDESAPPFVFRIGDPNVVPGVNEAIVGMRVGGFRRVVVPPNLAYQSPDMKPPVTEFFARRRLLSVLRTNRDATIVFEYVV